MKTRTFMRRWATAFAAAALIALMAAPVASAHESRQFGPFRVTVGMIAEPVYVGQKSGLEFRIGRGTDGSAEGVPELADVITAKVVKGGVEKDLEISARFGAENAGWYQSYFFPTEAGPFEFRLTGAVEGTSIDSTWIAGQAGEGATGGYGPVQELAGGQFPRTLPSDAQIAADVESAKMTPIALGAGIIGAVLGIVAIGLVLGSRRRTA